ncbi:metal-sensitive transcriptional regulator [Lactobacillus sp. PV034]|uniref:metal-sensitive transcriptional regulator n=1 Tax=Lactobacillus sp. PV034 TaxID=2594495 RepID=UPI0022408C8A|nr:metal-sensitive transcriptional regulator [Lactobacillus sp. PV034]QNQ80830.1 metal-sensitive transcriptional regulator [Lactobacillus sp. PV034]
MKISKEHQEHHQDKLLKRLNRISGQVNAVKKMVEEGNEDNYDKILIQINAARSALQRVSQILLEAQADHALLRVEDGANVADEMEKLQQVIKQYNKIN